ncbi:hypothetical protein ABKN59_010030 [Abortiporus biennis]
MYIHNVPKSLSQRNSTPTTLLLIGAIIPNTEDLVEVVTNPNIKQVKLPGIFSAPGQCCTACFSTSVSDRCSAIGIGEITI